MIKIYEACAMLNDEKAMQALLAPVPNSEGLRRVLKPGHSMRTQIYWKETSKAHYVLCDGKEVRLWTVTDVTLQQAATIAAKCDDIKEWDAEQFHAAVSRALGGEVTRIQ